MDSNAKRTGICLPGGKGGNQEFEAYPLSDSSSEKVIHASPQLQDQKETAEEGGSMVIDLKQTGHTGAKEGPAPNLAGNPGQLCLQPYSETSTSCLFLPLRVMNVHQAPHLRCPSRPQVRCQQTQPQTHSHWHKTMPLALGDKIRSRPRQQPSLRYQDKAHSCTCNHKQVMPQTLISCTKTFAEPPPLHHQEGMLSSVQGLTQTHAQTTHRSKHT